MAPSASDSSALPHSAQLGLVGMMNSITKTSAYGSMLRPSALQPRQSLVHAPSATPPETQGASPFGAVTDSAASTGGVGVALGVLPPLPPGAARTGSVGLPPASPMGARTQSDALQVGRQEAGLPVLRGFGACGSHFWELPLLLAACCVIVLIARAFCPPHPKCRACKACRASRACKA